MIEGLLPPEDFFGISSANRPRGVTSERDREIIRLVKEGMTRDAIAQALNLTYAIVGQRTRALGLKPVRKISERVWTQASERREVIRAAVAAGQREADIARDIGITRERVRQIIHKMGLFGDVLERRGRDRVAKATKKKAAKAAIRERRELAKEKLLERRLAQILPLRDRGLSVVEIANRMGVTGGIVSRTLIDAGMRSHPYRPRPKARKAKPPPKQRRPRPSTGFPEPAAPPAEGWTNKLIARLRRDWAAGLTTAHIGHRLGFSKNAIIGKAHRLHLPERPSPIRRGPR